MKYATLLPRLVLSLTGLSLFAIAARAASEVKVDLNRSGYDSTTTATGYVAWGLAATTGTAEASRVFTAGDGASVTVTFAMGPGANGTGLTTNWYKQYAQTNPDVDGSKMVSDGLTVAGGNAGARIVMTITGLPAGDHCLLTYHNAWDNPTAIISQGPIEVSLNGTPTTPRIQPTIRATSMYTTPVWYAEFTVSGTSDVVTILFDSNLADSAANVKSPVINGFEIDTGNLPRQAQSPSPSDKDEHVDAGSGSVTLGWSASPAGQAVSHNVYFGTSFDDVKGATTGSAEYKGSQTAATYEASGLSPLETYYWRIDEIDSIGNATKGAVWYFRPRQLAFPGAEGYGRFARGGRGGRVVEVTSLADYATGDTPIPGTLRYAIEQETGPRTIVFNVSGLITLLGRVTVNSPYITIAGQTAPGKGICIRGYTIGLSGASDVIIRHLRTRPGSISGATIDGMGMQGSDHSIIDHCSISWSIDEAFSSRSARNISLQRTLISEALNVAGHQNYPAGTMHGYAASISGDIGSFHHNLLAQCYGRNWSLAGGLDSLGFFAGRLDIRNNVVYNWGHRATDGGAHEVNFVGNYYKTGASTDFFYALNAQYESFPGTQQYYFDGNVMPGYFNEASQTAGREATGEVPTTYEPWVAAPFFTGSHITEHTAWEAYKSVLSDVGCTQPCIDGHDVRVVAETLGGTYTYAGSYSGLRGLPDNQADVGGWDDYGVAMRPAGWDGDHDGMPDYWEDINGLNPGVEDNNGDPDGDFTTNLEDYLNWLAQPHLVTQEGMQVVVDLSPWAAGLSSGGVYGVSNAVNGTVELLADGHSALFTPAAGFTGLASFDFTADDGVVVGATVGIAVAAAEPLPSWGIVRPGYFKGAGQGGGIVWRNRTCGAAALWNFNGVSIASAGAILQGGGTWAPQFTADFNNDGFSDILWADNAGNCAVWLMGADGFTEGCTIYEGGPVWRPAGTGDLDGDGNADIVWRNTSTGEVALWAMEGVGVDMDVSRTFYKGGRLFVPIATNLDLDGDGCDDIVWRGSFREIPVWLMNGSTPVQTGVVYSGRTGWDLVPEACGDFDGDGCDDLVWRNSRDGRAVVWLMNGLAVKEAADIAGTTHEWQPERAADLDGDGKADILWRSVADGSCAVTLMDGAAMKVDGHAGLVSGPTGWRVSGVCDLDRDGCEDLIWENGTDGSCAVWLMNGILVKDAASIFP